MRSLVEKLYPEYKLYRERSRELQLKDMIVWDNGWTWEEVLDYVEDHPNRSQAAKNISNDMRRLALEAAELVARV